MDSHALLGLSLVLLTLQSLAKGSLVDDLTPLAYPEPNSIAHSLFTPELRGYAISIQVHHSLLLTIALREPYAAGDEKALSFFGTKENIDPALCAPLPKAKTAILLFYYTSKEFFPSITIPFLAELTRLGVTPDPKSVHTSTPDGWAMHAACRLIDFFGHDGWNAHGLDGRQSSFFPQPYADCTGY